MFFFLSMSNSDSRIRSNALHTEFASAEMSLHAIYMHEVASRRWTVASGRHSLYTYICFYVPSFIFFPPKALSDMFVRACC